MKKISILILSVILMMGVSGCMNTGRNEKENIGINKAKTIHEKMLAYMNERYDDTFTFDSSFGGSVGIDSTQITVKSDKYPDEKIWVEYVVENGEEYYYDNYIDYKYENETKEYLLAIMCEVFNGSDVVVEYNVDSGGTRNEYDKSITFEQYIKGESTPIVFSAYIDTEIREQDKERVIDLITAKFVDKLEMKVVGKIYFEKSENSLFFITNDEGIKTQKWS